MSHPLMPVTPLNLKTLQCVFCRRAAASENRALWPFCSERCKQLDLGKWASEDYRIPGRPLSEEEDASVDSTEEETDDLAG